jgi:RES domain-containing protein
VKFRQAERPLYRIGRKPDPWAWPDWLCVAVDHTFGNRWDDLLGSYRVLYASSSLLGAFVDALARFRPDPLVVRELAEIHGEGEGLPPGCLDRSWWDVRRVGAVTLRGTFADVAHADSLARIQRDLAGRLVHYGMGELDATAIHHTAPRRLTQEISRYVFEQTTERGARVFDGISYVSRLRDDLRNWALFEPVTPMQVKVFVAEGRETSIEPEHPDFRNALELLGIRLLDRPGSSRHPRSD